MNQTIERFKSAVQTGKPLLVSNKEAELILREIETNNNLTAALDRLRHYAQFAVQDLNVSGKLSFARKLTEVINETPEQSTKAFAAEIVKPIYQKLHSAFLPATHHIAKEVLSLEAYEFAAEVLHKAGVCDEQSCPVHYADDDGPEFEGWAERGGENKL